MIDESLLNSLSTKEKEIFKKGLQDLINQTYVIEDEYKKLDHVWKAEKGSLQDAQAIKAELEKAKMEFEAARREAKRLALLVDGGTTPREEKEDKAEAHAAKQEAHAAKVREKVR